MTEVLREKDVCQRLKVSRETLRQIRRDAAQAFPVKRRIFGDVQGWISNEVEEWIRSRPLASR